MQISYSVYLVGYQCGDNGRVDGDVVMGTSAHAGSLKSGKLSLVLGSKCRKNESDFSPFI